MTQAIEKAKTQSAGLAQTEKPPQKISIIGGLQIKFGLQITQLGNLTTEEKLAVLVAVITILLLLVLILLIADNGDLIVKIISLLEKMLIFFQFALTTSQG